MQGGQLLVGGLAWEEGKQISVFTSSVVSALALGGCMNFGNSLKLTQHYFCDGNVTHKKACYM